MANEEQFQTDVGSFVRGPRGYTGATPNIAMEVATGEPGTNVQIEKSGTPENPAFRLTVPRGDTGKTPNITMEAATGEPGTDVQIEKSGTPENQAFRLTVPRGNPGDGVRYDEVQTLTDEQKAQAQANMGAASAESVSALKNDLADAWTAGKTYAVGDYCITGNRLYKCKTAHTAGSAFNADYWAAVNAASEIKSITDQFNTHKQSADKFKKFFAQSNETDTATFKSVPIERRVSALLIGNANGDPIFAFCTLFRDGGYTGCRITNILSDTHALTIDSADNGDETANISVSGLFFWGYYNLIVFYR